MHRHTTSRPFVPLFWVLVATGVLVVASAGLAQQPVTTASVPTFAGAMLKLRVEAASLLATVSGSTTNYNYQPAGRFQIWTDPLVPVGGNPTRSGDENRNIASVAVNGTYTSKITVAIDTDPLDQTQGYYYDVNELADAEAPNADPSLLTNYWPVAPSAGSRDIVGEFRLPVAFDANDDPTEYIRVRQILTVIGDAVQVEFVVTNSSTQRHSVGLRVCFDNLFGGASLLDGTPIFLPDGQQLAVETVIPSAADPNEIIPDRWVSYDNAASPNVAVRGTISGYEVTNPGTASSSAGRPSSIAWGQMRNIGQIGQYYFTPNSQASLVGEDTGYAVTWDLRDLSPGESRRYVTYYGMGTSTADYDPTYAMMAYAPFVLQAVKGDDPETTDTVEKYYYTDQMGRVPFPLAVYMDNFGTSSLLDASVRLRLPLGLELASGQSLSKSAGVIQRNQIKNVSWDVRATAARPGRAQVKYTGPQGKVLTRDINIPAVPVLNPLPGSLNGLEMVSVPYEFTNTDAEWVFQSLGSLLPGGPATLIRYHPQLGYRLFPDTFTTNVNPGQGFWLLNGNREVVELPDDATAVDETMSYNVNVMAGWNQIGNPFLVNLRFDQVRVMPASGGEWSMEEAVARNVLLPTLFSYDTTANAYKWETSLADTRMDPYVGYWLLTREACTLIFPPPSISSPAKATPASKPVGETVGPNNWRLPLVVSTPSVPAAVQSLAVHKGAEVGLDRYDVAQPPTSVKPAAVYLKSALYSSESALGMPYLQDTRAPGQGAQQWNLMVQTNALNQPVTVTWPALQSLPRDLIATLVDPVTGTRQYMRTTTGYTFRTGDQPTERLLQVIVQPRPASALVVSGVTAASAGRGNVDISYTLTSEAAVDVKIRNMAGIIVSTPAVDRLSPAGSNQLLWSGLSNRGTSVPSGRYLCEVTARSVITGEAVSAIAPLDVRR